jgi:hypothetical protein
MATSSFAALTMVRDDIFFLKKWIRYYGDQFGRENLYIINHAREPAVTEAAEGCNLIGIPEGDTTKFDHKRWRLMNGLFSGLLGYYTHVIVGDVDEYVVADPAYWTSLGECLRKTRGSGVLTPFGLEVTHLEARESDGIEPAILGPRRYVQVATDYAKPCVLSTFTRLSRGGHYSEHKELNCPAGLYLFHMRYADRGLYEDTMNRRNKVVAATGAQKPQDIMIGRHWFASKRDDDSVFKSFAARKIKSEWGFMAERRRMASSWRERDTKGSFWQFDDMEQTCLFEVPERMFGLV